MQVSYDGFVGFTDPNVAGAPKMLTPQEQADWTHVAYRNNAAANGTAVQYTHPQYGNQAQATLPDWLHANGQNGVRGAIDRAAIDAAQAADPDNVFLFKPNLAGTNWYDAITRTGLLMRHGLGFSGGIETSRFYMGVNLQDQAGILLNNDFKRYTFRLNSEYDLGKHVRFGENLQVTYRSVFNQKGRIERIYIKPVGKRKSRATHGILCRYGGFVGLPQTKNRIRRVALSLGSNLEGVDTKKQAH
jgi:hypothetical protein